MHVDVEYLQEYMIMYSWHLAMRIPSNSVYSQKTSNDGGPEGPRIFAIANMASHDRKARVVEIPEALKKDLNSLPGWSSSR